jgi:hypothetical protein
MAVVSLLNSKAVGARRTCTVETVEVNFNSETWFPFFLLVAPVGWRWEHSDGGADQSNRYNQPKEKDYGDDGCNFGFCHGVNPPPVRARSLPELSPSSSSQFPQSDGFPAGPSHVDNGAASFKANFIHQRFHQVDSTAMAGLDIFKCGRVWDVVRVKSLSLIPDDDRNFVSPAATANVHLLPRVSMVAMNDGIRQGLA